MRLQWAVIASFLALGGSSSAEQYPMAVDLELVIAVDVSYSMGIEEQRVQRAGYAAAFLSPEIVRALRGGALGKIAVTYVEWGGSAIQVVPWTPIDSAASAARFAEELRRQPMRRISFTSISNALAFARELIRSNRYQASRRVIDVSGDGPNNAGAPVSVARNASIAEGIVIDGLPIMLEKAPDSASIPDIDVYYEKCVIGGDGAFVLRATDIRHFPEAIRHKLVREISGLKLSGVPQLGLQRVQYTEPYNCLVGEELQEQSIGK
ncbi:hypothetical protein CU102_00055 [Phyllobacterium brassicacearum]|uniref:DUF1194 domain-containing protein n=1 Tax=Phyllobacterium brassicacearum TaxID=314235 RepID=A0A2P7BVM2_9HYPH|nr:DUF1194 domain-containing protein [Phyllobacterium brassicacearum]PSH70500.1 hypothetical protein CU102_00055 [Phyllobacterium brassicacearum]TDQ36060.1 uncharacterized protein DUF1194 [Phyllobacterium brassicacearum]